MKKTFFHAEIAVPDDEMERHDVLAKVRPAWATFLAAIKDAGLTCTHESRTKTVREDAGEPRPQTRGPRPPARRAQE